MTVFLHLSPDVCNNIVNALISVTMPAVLWHCWLGGRKGIRPVKNWAKRWGAGMVICLQRGADLHMAQLMPLPLTVSSFSKIHIGFTFLVPAHPGSPDKRPLNRCVRVCDLSDTVTKITVSVILSIICMCCTLHKCRLCLIVNNVGPAMIFNSESQSSWPTHSPEMTEVQGWNGS